MMKREYIGGIGLAFLVAVLFLPTVAVATVAPPTTVVINYQVSGSGLATGTIDTGLNWADIYANPDTIYTWSMPSSMEIDLEPGNTAYIDGLSIGVKADPRISFGFSASAGNSNTHFTFTSNLMLINPALINAQGSASASVTIGAPGGTLTGNYDGGTEAYRALYNGSQIFADLVNTSTPVSWPGASGFVGSTPISGQVSSMQAMWDVTVSGGGSASGSSLFTISGDTIPEPATIALLGLGAFSLFSRKRN
jgi:hypothetical protein